MAFTTAEFSMLAFQLQRPTPGEIVLRFECESPHYPLTFMHHAIYGAAAGLRSEIESIAGIAPVVAFPFSNFAIPGNVTIDEVMRGLLHHSTCHAQSEMKRGKRDTFINPIIYSSSLVLAGYRAAKSDRWRGGVRGAAAARGPEWRVGRRHQHQPRRKRRRRRRGTAAPAATAT